MSSYLLTCTRCKKKFKNQRALTQHQRKSTMCQAKKMPKVSYNLASDDAPACGIFDKEFRYSASRCSSGRRLCGDDPDFLSSRISRIRSRQICTAPDNAHWPESLVWWLSTSRNTPLSKTVDVSSPSFPSETFRKIRMFSSFTVSVWQMAQVYTTRLATP